MRWVVGLLVVGLFAGCGRPSSREDVDGFRADFEAGLSTSASLDEAAWDRYLAVARGICRQPKTTFAFTRAVAVDEGRVDEVERVIRFLCPHRLTES